MTRTIEMIAPDKLRPWAKNARTHSRKQIRQIASSIEAFGFVNPVLIDEAARPAESAAPAALPR